MHLKVIPDEYCIRSRNRTYCIIRLNTRSRQRPKRYSGILDERSPPFSPMLRPLLAVSLCLSILHISVYGTEHSEHEGFLRYIETGNVPEAKKLLDTGIDVNVKRPGDQNTALIIAAGKGRMEVVNLLLSRGADVNVSNRNGWTPLMAAVSSGSYGIALLLLEKGADPNSKHTYGWTALKLASQKGKEDIVKLLKKFGARN